MLNLIHIVVTILATFLTQTNVINGFIIAPKCSNHKLAQNGNYNMKQPISSISSSTTLSSSTNPSGTNVQQQQQLKIPLTWDEMIRQASSCMKQAAMDGSNLQIVRILLPRDSTSGDFGKYWENEESIKMDGTTTSTGMNYGDIKLVPPDESWQGGIMQLYRAATPTAFEMVRKLSSDISTNNLPPRISEDRTVDESGVDGVGLLTTDDKSIACWIQPTQDNVDGFINSAKLASSQQIVILLNPQWRQVDDALDTASKQNENPFLKGLANFLGGKGAVLQQIKDIGYKPVYTLEGYVCRGANVRLLQYYPNLNEWNVFCERDDLESYVSVGTITTGSRPTYQEVEEMMTKADIGYKYARDIGLQPKL